MRVLCLAAVAVLLSFAAPGITRAAPSQRSGAVASFAELADIERSIANIEAEEAVAASELAKLPSAISEAHAHLVKHGRAFYRRSRLGALAIGGGFESFVGHAMQTERLRRLLVADVEAEKKAGARSDFLRKKIGEMSKAKQALAVKRAAIESARFAIEDDVRRQDAFGRAFEGASRSESVGGGSIVVYGSAEPRSEREIDDGVGFRLAKGKLIFPVIGEAKPQNAKREGAGGPGLEIHAAAGTVVRAVYSGRVAFADRYAPYGRMLIVDHGDHYFSVSGNLATIDVKVGDTVMAGSRIGTVGDDGKGAMLYFEVRHGAETLPPRPWLGI